MPICVAIEVSADGAVSVGVLPPEVVGGYADTMNPAQSIDAALETVRDLLSPTPAAATNEVGRRPLFGQDVSRGAEDRMWDQVKTDRARY